MRGASQGGRALRRVLRRGSKKGLSRRRLEGRNTPFREYGPLRVRPIHPYFPVARAHDLLCTIKFMQESESDLKAANKSIGELV